MRRVSVTTMIAIAFALAACGDGTGPGASVAIQFAAVGPGASPTAAPTSGPAAASNAAAQGELVIPGTNGTLTITQIGVIVEEFELEPVEVGDCDDDNGPTSVECEDFETRYFFIDVPLDGEPVTVVNHDIPEGLYDELELEVDDLEVDDDDPEDLADAQLIQDLLNSIRQQLDDWPDKASMVVSGEFTPTDGDPVGFRAYFEAEIEVELDLSPPLEVTADMASKSIVVELVPEVWFKRGDGTVWDLSQFDFQTTGELIEFELEMEDGFELEIDD